MHTRATVVITILLASVLTTAGKDLLRNFLRGASRDFTTEDTKDTEAITRPNTEERRTQRYTGGEQRIAEPSLTSASAVSAALEKGAV